MARKNIEPLIDEEAMKLKLGVRLKDRDPRDVASELEASEILRANQASRTKAATEAFKRLGGTR